MGNGAAAYMYWNIALEQGGLSRWGWAQNSLVTVDTAAATFRWNPEYYLLKHVSHFVRTGARAVRTLSYTGYENQLAFVNPDGSLVVVIHNDSAQEQTSRVMIGDRMVTPTLPPDSFSTLVVPAPTDASRVDSPS